MAVRIVLLLGVLVTTAGLFLGATFIEWLAASADGSGLLAGPTHGGAWFLMPWLVVNVYFIGAVVLFAGPTRRGRSPLRFAEFLRLSCTGGAGRITATVLGCGAAATFYGLSAYWCVTTKQLTVHHGWGAGTAIYSWAEVSTRSIGCVRGRLDYVLRFDLKMADGQFIDLASAPRKDFALHLSELLKLTSNVDTVIGDLEHCPAVFREFLQRSLRHV